VVDLVGCTDDVEDVLTGTDTTGWVEVAAPGAIGTVWAVFLPTAAYMIATTIAITTSTEMLKMVLVFIVNMSIPYAGDKGIEPLPTVLETVVLPLN
jgi:hypothetical protein